MKKIHKHYGRFASYMRRTALNKLCSIIFIGLGYGSVLISNDATFLVMTLIIGVPLFFVNDNYIG